MNGTIRVKSPEMCRCSSDCVNVCDDTMRTLLPHNRGRSCEKPAKKKSAFHADIRVEKRHYAARMARIVARCNFHARRNEVYGLTRRA